MPFSIVELPKQFRPKTSIVYPPFKNGRYMEEYFYDFFIEYLENKETETETEKQEIENTKTEEQKKQWSYIPVFWTNIQNHPGFMKTCKTLSHILSDLLKEYHKKHPNTNFFTIVQHDDGILLNLPKEIKDKLLIFGACTGDIPLPLIYEDTTETIEKYRSKNQYIVKKEFQASFIGSETHPVRKLLIEKLQKNPKIKIQSSKSWTNSISSKAADNFLETTIKSEFCLAPRGYGRSSFRYFEAIQLGVIPVYIWDDKEWLPYKDFINYNDFSISINVNEIDKLPEILEKISNNSATYSSMINNLMNVNLETIFSLKFMGYYILHKMCGGLKFITNVEIVTVPFISKSHPQQ